MEQNSSSANMVDTTDSLEAVNVFKSMKNFTFWLILLSLLVLLGLFLMAKLGRIQESAVTEEPQSTSVETSLQGAILPLAAVPAQPEGTEEESSETREKAQSEESYVPIAEQAREITNEEMAETGQEDTDEPLRAESESDEPTKPLLDMDKFHLTPKQAVVLINVFNYVCLFSAAFYSLTLLFCLKISLTARLGGIKHIARAFFLSMFAFLFLFPWQAILPRMMVGALYLPSELIGEKSWLAKGPEASGFLMILRFVGLWLVVFVLYVWSQFRSMKWAQAILKRLGIVK